MQGHLYRHFISSGHRGFFNDASVTIVDKTDGSDTKKWDDYPGAYLGYIMLVAATSIFSYIYFI